MEALLFAAAGVRFLAPLADLDEILMPARLGPLAGAPGFIAGVINLRGSALAVLTLAERLGRAPPPRWERGARILRCAADGHPLGVIVDTVAGIRSLAPDQRRPPLLGAGRPRFLGDLWLIDGVMVQEVRLPDLLAPGEAERLAFLTPAVPGLNPGSNPGPNPGPNRETPDA